MSERMSDEQIKLLKEEAKAALLDGQNGPPHHGGISDYDDQDVWDRQMRKRFAGVTYKVPSLCDAFLARGAELRAAQERIKALSEESAEAWRQLECVGCERDQARAERDEARKNQLTDWHKWAQGHMTALRNAACEMLDLAGQPAHGDSCLENAATVICKCINDLRADLAAALEARDSIDASLEQATHMMEEAYAERERLVRDAFIDGVSWDGPPEHCWDNSDTKRKLLCAEKEQMVSLTEKQKEIIRQLGQLTPDEVATMGMACIQLLVLHYGNDITLAEKKVMDAPWIDGPHYHSAEDERLDMNANDATLPKRQEEPPERLCDICDAPGHGCNCGCGRITCSQHDCISF